MVKWKGHFLDRSSQIIELIRVFVFVLGFLLRGDHTLALFSGNLMGYPELGSTLNLLCVTYQGFLKEPSQGSNSDSG